MTEALVLSDAVERISRLCEHYKRDLPFRAPESVPEHQARLLNQIHGVLSDAAEESA